MIDLLETNITSHGSIKDLGSGSERKSLGHVAVPVGVVQLNRLSSLGTIVGGGEGGGGADKEKGVGELHFDI